MKLRLGLALVLLTCSLANAAPQPEETTTRSLDKTMSPFEQKLIQNEQAFLDAEQRGDVQYVENAVSKDYASVASNGGDSDYNELMDGVKSAAKEKHNSNQQPMRYFFEVVQLDDDCAVVSYNTVNPGDHPRYLHTSDTWVKQGDQWKLKFRQSTPNLWSATDID